MSEKRFLTRSRLWEVAAMAMIGDGMLALADPRRHVGLWADGPRWWRQSMQLFLDRPGMTRMAGALELGAGLWLASRQQ